MADLIFADADLAALYDAMNPGREDYDFYRPMVMGAASVLDVGCGTGSMLHAARDAGHKGRLCGLVPAPGMLAQAGLVLEAQFGDWDESPLTETSPEIITIARRI